LRAALEKERIRDVRAGISRLKPMDREALQAFYLEGRTLREISARLNAPLGTIKRRLHTARRRFSAEMEDHAGV
jgi:RNA polymerase sigma-70 factor (ECF subfamily)